MRITAQLLSSWAASHATVRNVASHGVSDMGKASNAKEPKEVLVAKLGVRQAVTVGLITSLAAVMGAALPAWWESSGKEQELSLSQDQMALESANVIVQWKDDLLSTNSAKRLVAISALQARLHPTVAEKFFASMAKQTGDERGEWKAAQEEARNLEKLLPVYHFAITPFDNVSGDALERLIVNELFAKIQIYRRNVRSTLHSLSKTTRPDGKLQYLWIISLDLVGGTVGGAEDRLFYSNEERVEIARCGRSLCRDTDSQCSTYRMSS
jgi:hypothetical protein